MRRVSISNGQDLRSYQNRVTSLSEENLSLKRDVAEKNNLIGELEARFRAAYANAAPTITVTSRPLTAESVLNTELELLRTRMTSVERVALVCEHNARCNEFV